MSLLSFLRVSESCCWRRFILESMALEYVEAQQEEWVLVVEEEQVQEAMVLVVEQGLELVGSVQVVVKDPESVEVVMDQPRQNEQEEPRPMEPAGGRWPCR